MRGAPSRRRPSVWRSDGRPVAVGVALFGLAAVLLQAGEPERAARLFAAGKRECRRAGAKLIRFHTRFADRIESELHRVAGLRLDEVSSLGLDEAVRMGSITD